MKEDVQLEFEDGGLNTHVLTDGNRLFQVISNLITNAQSLLRKDLYVSVTSKWEIY